MMKNILIAPVMAACLSVAYTGAYTAASAQTPAPQTSSASAADAGISANRAVGEVLSVDAAQKVINLKADGGTVVAVSVDEKTIVMRAQPGAKSLDGATKIVFSDVAVGDRVLAIGKVAEDHKSVPARQVVVMTKADIAQKQEHDRAEWKRRGIVGTVAAVNPEAHEITINSRSRAGMQPVIIAADASKVSFRRYTPDSIKFSDAKPSSFAEVKVGDQLRALGDKSEDGSRFTPQEVVTGSFKTLNGSVVSVNAAANEIRIIDLQTKQPVTISVRPESLLKRLPPEFVARMAMRGQGGPGGGAPGAGGPPQGDGARPSGAPGGREGPRGGGGRMGGGGFDFQDVLERLPAVSVADLKVGDMVIVSSTTSNGSDRVTAIAVVAGVEALLNARQAAPGDRPGAQNAAPTFGSDITFGIGLP
jgi:co-chaperonin GroES (HSP10)